MRFVAPVLILALSGCSAIQAIIRANPETILQDVAIPDLEHALQIAKDNNDGPGIACLQQLHDGAQFIQRSKQGAQGFFTTAEVARVIAREGHPADCIAAIGTGR